MGKFHERRQFGTTFSLQGDKILTNYSVGTGGWAYFQVRNKPPLEAYSEVFNFVEVNSTFYEYPRQRLVESWRRTVPSGFMFSVRCHQDLTHRIGLKPSNEAFEVFYKMKAYCDILEAPYLVLETAARQAFDEKAVKAARDLFSSVSFGGLRLVWEYRAPFTTQIGSLMQDFRIIQSVDLSLEKPTVHSDVTYSRLFGKGKHNIYQFDDSELLEIERKAEEIHAKQVILAYHGMRMNTYAIRSQTHLQTGHFLPVTNAVGVDSAKAVLAEDAQFPASKAELIADQGWKVIDLVADRRVHLSTVLKGLPEKTYRSLGEVASALKAVM
jgi:uncharacterized protein YecE (DUF72 family)